MPGQAVAAAADLLLRMRCGEQVELQSGMDPTVVWREMNELSPRGYRFVSLQAGSAADAGHPPPDGREWSFGLASGRPR